MAKQKILVAGASGLVGYGAVRLFGKLPDWEVLAVSRRAPSPIESVKFLSVDLLDAARCREIFGQMSDVTHLAYAALSEKPGIFAGWVDRAQMDVNLEMLRNLFDPLEAAAKNLRHVSLLQGTKAYGGHTGAMVPIPARECAPRHPHENFYWLQEDYLRAKQAGKTWCFTILRPQIVIGEAIGGNLSLIPPLGVYAALLREEGSPLYFPGVNPSVFELVDTDLLARSMEWSATSESARNETFNITNGDVATWQDLWPVIADTFGMEPGPTKPLSLAEELPKRQADWAAIVKKYNLAAPADLKAYLGESHYFADACFGYHKEGGESRRSRPSLVSTIKVRQAGFHDCIDSADMLRKWIRQFQQHRLLPLPK
ncbi:MAG TPA: SDR family oxidoreductase [Bryobacteraceae bacterium]|nr:SDR family oxidoreductase [Bryobacteraceae bacterium]